MSGIIQVTLLLIAMGLALLPFFEWYKPDVPHRMAAIKQLEEAMPPELLSEDAEWFQAWKASGIDQEVYLPRYFKQLDLPGGERKCFTSSGAMAAAYFKKIATQEAGSYTHLTLPTSDPV